MSYDDYEDRKQENKLTPADTDPTLYRHVVIQLEDCPVDKLEALKGRIRLFALVLEMDGQIHGFDFAVNKEKGEL